MHEDELCMINHHIVLLRYHFYQSIKYTQMRNNDNVLSKKILYVAIKHISNIKTCNKIWYLLLIK